MTLLAVDGNSIVNRAFFGIRLLTTKDGRPTNAIYGFLAMLDKIKETCSPDAVAIAFDVHAPTFRHKMYSEYKAGRKGMPEELFVQMAPLKKLLSELGYKLVECEGYEADDILGTLARVCEEAGEQCVIATGDRDSLQLVSDKTHVYLTVTKMGKPEAAVYDVDKIRETYGVAPAQMIEIKALQGDTSDNIPGVRGIGQKGAAELIQRYGSVDYIYENLDKTDKQGNPLIDVKPAMYKKLTDGKDSAYLSRTLGTIVRSVPIDTELSYYTQDTSDLPAAVRTLASLELFSFIDKWNLRDVADNSDTTLSTQDNVDNENTLPKLQVNSLCAEELIQRTQAQMEIYFLLYSGEKDGDILSIDFDETTEVLTESSAVKEVLSCLLPNEKIKKYTADTKALYAYAIRNNIETRSVVFDTTLAGYLLNPNASSYDIPRLSDEYAVPSVKYTIGDVETAVQDDSLKSDIYKAAGCEFDISSDEQLGKVLFEKLGIAGGKKSKDGAYTVTDKALEKLSDKHPIVSMVLGYRRMCARIEKASLAVSLPKLTEALSAKLEANGQMPLLRDMEIPLARVLASMELIGCMVDSRGIADYGDKLSDKCDELRQGIYSSAECEFNINSPKQLGEVLFERLGLQGGKKTKTGYSTSAEVLEGLRYAHPVVDMILEYRSLSKLKSTYCDGLLKAADSTGRIHSVFNQTETRTGRISSLEPNLQNIPVRTEVGREMRRFFTAPSGWKLVDADYSQIELRVLAHIANDKNMIQAFTDGVDVHTVTASQVFGLPIDMVTPSMRTRAKAVNFGIVYGIGAFSLAKDINVSRREASDYIKAYLAHYSGVDSYMNTVVAEAKDKGYVETMYGRRRYLPELTSSNHNLRAFGERVARNMPIQGTAADIIKVAMVRVYERLKKENMRSRLILQVHDELIVEAPEDEAEAAAAILKEEMESAVRLRVPLVADANVGDTWYEAKG